MSALSFTGPINDREESRHTHIQFTEKVAAELGFFLRALPHCELEHSKCWPLMERTRKSSFSVMLAMFLLMGVHPMDMKETHVQFFMHDIIKGRNATAVKVTDGSSGFGVISVIDDPLTEGPQHNSRALGRARGMYMSDALQDISLLLVFTVVFEAGEHQGSTLSFQGQDIAALKQREISVVGGTGHFRSATGHATIETQFLTATNAVLRFNVTVVH